MKIITQNIDQFPSVKVTATGSESGLEADVYQIILMSILFFLQVLLFCLDCFKFFSREHVVNNVIVLYLRLFTAILQIYIIVILLHREPEPEQPR